LAFYRNYKILPERFNLLGLSGQAKEPVSGRTLPSTRWPEEVNQAVILHWNGAIKPWMCSATGPSYSALWHSYSSGENGEDRLAGKTNTIEEDCDEGVWTYQPTLWQESAQLTVLLMCVLFSKLATTLTNCRPHNEAGWPSLKTVVGHLLKLDAVGEIVLPHPRGQVSCIHLLRLYHSFSNRDVLSNLAEFDVLG
jgi:hypothetical protein